MAWLVGSAGAAGFVAIAGAAWSIGFANVADGAAARPAERAIYERLVQVRAIRLQPGGLMV